MKKIMILTMLLLGSISISFAQTPGTTSLKVGAAKRNITAPSNFFPFHPMHEKCAYMDIHDTLYARVIVMDNSKKRAVLVELDEVQVPDPDEMTADVATAANVNKEDVILCVSHTHATLHPNGEDPRLNPVIDNIKRQTVQAVKAAVASLQPATIAFQRTQAYVNINNGEIVHSTGQYDNDAFSDKTLDIVRFAKPNGEALAMVLNYSTHAEIMFRSVCKDGGYEITGDLPGRVAQLLENGNGAPVVLTTAGPEADQQPIFTSHQHTTTMGFVDQGAGGWSIVDVLAYRLVDAVNEAVSTMPAGTDNVELSTAFTVAVTPGQHMHQDKRSGDIIKEPAPDVNIPISQIRLNDIAFDGVGADVASQIGVNIRNASKVKNTMLITCTAGAVGYILPDVMYDHPTHGVFGSRVKPGFAQQAIIKAFARITK
jgi:hypothetical protein